MYYDPLLCGMMLGGILALSIAEAYIEWRDERDTRECAANVRRERIYATINKGRTARGQREI